MSKEWPLRLMANIIGPCWTIFFFTKLKRRIVATFGLNSTALSATQPKLHSMFCTLFLKLALSAWTWCVWQPQSCDLKRLDYRLWGVVKDKCYADKLETIDALKDNIRAAVGEIELYTIDNVLKNWIDRISYCMANRGSYLNEIILHY